MIFLKKNFKTILTILVLVIAAFYRFWDVKDYVVFLGDEGRDMIILRDIFTEKKIPFLGPTASVGGFYLGPIYYWMTAPFLLLWHFDPAGPSYFVAAIGLATVFLLYKFLKEALGFWPAILSSSLYAVAPLIVRYSRSSWNPNPLPFFVLLMMYLIYLGSRKKDLKYFLAAGASFGVSIQLHYLAAILLAIAGLIILVNTSYKQWIKIVFLASVGFLITFSPFLLFEIRHGFPNFVTIHEFVTRGTTTGFKSLDLVWLAANYGNILLEDISTLKGTIVTWAFFWFTVIATILGLIKFRNDKKNKLIFSIGIIWFIGGLLGLRFYTGQVYDYYFGLMFPAPFVLFGLSIFLFWRIKIMRFLLVVVTVLIFMYFTNNSFFKNPPNRLIEQTEKTSEFVIEKTETNNFNFALISDSNSDHAYRYFLEIKGHEPKQLEELVTNQLIVVCESKKCEPLGHPIWEIAGFGRSQIVDEWTIKDYGIRIFKLIHHPDYPSPVGKPAEKGV